MPCPPWLEEPVTNRRIRIVERASGLHRIIETHSKGECSAGDSERASNGYCRYERYTSDNQSCIVKEMAARI